MMMSFYIGKDVYVQIFLHGAIAWTPEHLERIGEHLVLVRNHLEDDLRAEALKELNGARPTAMEMERAGRLSILAQGTDRA